jgi:hypothetical protein
MKAIATLAHATPKLNQHESLASGATEVSE